MKKTTLSRRNFMEKTAAFSLGTGVWGISSAREPVAMSERLPREVWIGSVSTSGLRAENSKAMTEKVLRIMENMIPYKPDIVCLPEVFAFSGIDQPFKVREVAEQVPGPVVEPFVRFAKQNGCYVICPTYSRYGGDIYIAAALIDRKGKIVGEYHKARPTDGEIETGVRPGPLDPPVFNTDFGKIGIQICFDIKWEEGWQKLKAGGAEIIFWPSAYSGGREVNSRAWRHQVHLVSSTLKDTSKICDITGEVIAQTGRWQPNWLCAPVNLEKAFLHTWPAVRLFSEMQMKYGRRIRLTTFDEEEWTIIESLDPELKVADILAEYQLRNHYDHLVYNTQVQEKNR